MCGKSVFRTDQPTQFMFCPYCKVKANNVSFTTDNQKQLLSSYCFAVCSAISERKSVTIDLDEQADDLSDLNFLLEAIDIDIVIAQAVHLGESHCTCVLP